MVLKRFESTFPLSRRTDVLEMKFKSNVSQLSDILLFRERLKHSQKAEECYIRIHDTVLYTRLYNVYKSDFVFVFYFEHFQTRNNVRTDSLTCLISEMNVC